MTEKNNNPFKNDIEDEIKIDEVENEESQSEEVSEDIVEEVESENSLDNDSEQPVTYKSKSSGYHSDNVNMVIDLFEGKFIE